MFLRGILIGSHLSPLWSLSLVLHLLMVNGEVNTVELPPPPPASPPPPEGNVPAPAVRLESPDHVLSKI
jgi:hypothetical protein